MFMKVSNFATFLRLFLLKILSLGLGMQLSRTMQLSPGFTPQNQKNNRKRSSVNSGHQTLHFFPLSMRKSYLKERPKMIQPDDSEGQISDKIHHYIQFHLNIPGNQFQFVPKYPKPVDALCKKTLCKKRKQVNLFDAYSLINLKSASHNLSCLIKYKYYVNSYTIFFRE